MVRCKLMDKRNLCIHTVTLTKCYNDIILETYDNYYSISLCKALHLCTVFPEITRKHMHTQMGNLRS